MADAYQSLSAGGDIGALLRLIQEEKAGSILNAPPSNETGSPIRDVATGPILSPESPASNRIASLRPEGAVSATDTSGAVVGPSAPLPRVASVIGPAAAPTPGPTPSRPSSPTSPSAAPSNIAQLARSLPNIGTAIKAVLGSKAPAKQTNSPTRTTRGSIISNPQGSKKAAPTPTPGRFQGGQPVKSNYVRYTA